MKILLFFKNIKIQDDVYNIIYVNVIKINTRYLNIGFQSLGIQ